MDETSKRQRDQRGRLLPAEAPDDYTRYVMGATDEAALAAKAAHERERRAAASEAAGRGRPESDDKWDKHHNIMLSARLDDVIDQLRGTVPVGRWLREAAMEKAARDGGIPLEDLDPARRAAPRRQNTARRQRPAG